MAAGYESYYLANLSAVSAAGATYVDILSRNFAPTEPKDFVFFGGGYNMTINNNAIDIYHTMVLDSFPSVVGEFRRAGNDYPQPGGLHYAHAMELPVGAYNLKTQQKSNASGSTASRGNHVLAIGGLNIVAEGTLVASAAQTTSEATVLTVNYTPDEAGKDYLILAYCDILPPSGGEIIGRVKVDASEKMEARGYRNALGALSRPLFFSKKVTWDDSAHSVTVTGQSVTTSGGTVENVYVSIIQITA